MTTLMLLEIGLVSVECERFIPHGCITLGGVGVDIVWGKGED